MKYLKLLLFLLLVSSCTTLSKTPQHRYDLNTGIRLGNTSKINFNFSNTDCSTYIYSFKRIFSGSMWVRIPCDSILATKKKTKTTDESK
jgi:hypothetical protein